MKLIGAFCALMVGLLMTRYGWLCVYRHQLVNSAACLFWVSEKGWKRINVLAIAFLIFLAIYGFVCLLSGNWQGVIATSMVILAGLIGIASQRITRSLSVSFYQGMSDNPTVVGIFYLVLGLVFIIMALIEFLKVFM